MRAWGRGAAAFCCLALAGCLGGAPASPGPDGGSPGSDGSSSDPFASNEQHCLDVLNMYRAQNGAGPLSLDAQLTEFALTGSQDLAAGGAPHQHFIDASNSGEIWNDGFCNGAAENQAPGWPASDVNQTIDAILQSMMAEGPGGGHHDNIVNPSYTRVGVGLVLQSGNLYFTNDFSPPCN